MRWLNGPLPQVLGNKNRKERAYFGWVLVLRSLDWNLVVIVKKKTIGRNHHIHNKHTSLCDVSRCGYVIILSDRVLPKRIYYYTPTILLLPLLFIYLFFKIYLKIVFFFCCLGFVAFGHFPKEFPRSNRSRLPWWIVHLLCPQGMLNSYFFLFHCSLRCNLFVVFFPLEIFFCGGFGFYFQSAKEKSHKKKRCFLRFGRLFTYHFTSFSLKKKKNDNQKLAKRRKVCFLNGFGRGTNNHNNEADSLAVWNVEKPLWITSFFFFSNFSSRIFRKKKKSKKKRV